MRGFRKKRGHFYVILLTTHTHSKNNVLNITRYPHTQNRSLRAWSAADEYILKRLENGPSESKTTVISNDTFGFLSCHLHNLEPIIVIERQSQQKSIEKNLAQNGLKPDTTKWISPLQPLPEKADLGIISIPKSMELFRLYLRQIHSGLNENGEVICSFMTRHFTPQMLAIAGEFFDETDQSLAWKKSRLLTLKKRKPIEETELLNRIPFTFKHGETEEIKQYPGVFSSDHIDYATQFLMEHLKLDENENCVLDLASGNGIIARAIQLEKPGTELHLMDDSLLAVESSKLNLHPENTHFHWNDSLEEIGDFKFDLVVSNPPFHFEHEVNTEVAVDLFREVAGSLKPGGRFLCVANQHLGYRTYLKKFFTRCELVAGNDKFVLFENSMAG